ncbi:MAG: 3-deoxy-D-manno-octulosonic acid transferase [Bacteroidales bacterium]|nr:3-deoxy-D-manno-octulosonic acid transferase [Bacteroidales bacterium]
MVAGITLARRWNTKARQWVEGRRGWEDGLRRAFSGNTAEVLWFHVSSLGEFEQGRELLAACRARYPEKKILLTFFSPSGYEMCKETPLADVVAYLPADLPRNARRFLDIVRPQAAVFVKYEYWFNFMREMAARRIPHYFVAARFRSTDYFFQWYARWFKRHLQRVTAFFVQDEASLVCLRNNGIPQAYVAGDTRCDRVVRLKKEAADFPMVAYFAGKAPLIVAGSVWDEDADLIRDCHTAMLGNYRWLVVPHEIKGSRIHHIEESGRLEGCCLYSRLSQLPENEWRAALDAAKILVIDEVGHLSKLYRYGRIAYIGGGFGKGIHNTLEPAAYGLPVLFGPNYEKFSEAVELVEAGAAFPVRNVAQLDECLQRLSRPEDWRKSAETAARYVQEHAGAVETIMRHLIKQW